MKTWEMVGGLDPSLSNFGMSRGAVVDGKYRVDSIYLTTTTADKKCKYKNMDDLRRAQELGKDMLEFFEGIDTIYVELPVGSQSARAMASYGICVGVIAALGKRVIRVSAKDAKEVACDDPKATKADMIEWATTLYPDLPWLTHKRHGEIVYTGANEHVADSIAAVHAGIKKQTGRTV